MAYAAVLAARASAAACSTLMPLARLSAWRWTTCRPSRRGDKAGSHAAASPPGPVADRDALALNHHEHDEVAGRYVATGSIIDIPASEKARHG